MRDTAVRSEAPSHNDGGPAPADRLDKSRTRRLRLLAEGTFLYLFVPLGLAIFLPPSAMFSVLLGFTVVGLVLLHFTPGFEWRELVMGAGRIEWGHVIALGAATFVVSSVVVLATVPSAYFVMLRDRPQMLLMILLAYPFVSALPQELLFRPLFFRRYGELLPRQPVALVVNAGLFSLAHLLYWNWVVATMTFFGGIAFAWAYEVRRNFPMAVAMHAVAGGMIFTVGLGIYFYTGNIARPF